MFKKEYLVIIFISIFCLALGFFLGKILNNCQTQEVGGVSFEQGWQAAKQRILETGFIEPERMDPKGIKMIVGSVEKIEGDIVHVSIRPLSPLADKNLDIRYVVLPGDIKMIRTIKKDEKQYAEEMKDFQNKDNATFIRTAMDSNAPSLYQNIEINPSDLKIGDRISVFSEADITNSKKISPVKIIVN